jgi:RNA polymerase sigma-70 factor (ECF subfamily)
LKPARADGSRLSPKPLDDDDLTRVEELAADGAAGAMDLVDGLPERQRAAVRAHVVDARSYAEIAGELSCSELVVRQRVSRGLSRLRNELTEREK